MSSPRVAPASLRFTLPYASSILSISTFAELSSKITFSGNSLSAIAQANVTYEGVPVPLVSLATAE